MALTQTRIGDLHEFRALAKILQSAAARIAHRGLHAADELMDHILGRPLEGHMPLDPFGEQLHLVIDILLERKSVVLGKSVSVRVELGGRRLIKKKNNSRLAYMT